nr:hypothetical protein [Tanacetum cinerariifolium]
MFDIHKDWMVIPSGFQELEVRMGHEAYEGLKRKGKGSERQRKGVREAGEGVIEEGAMTEDEIRKHIEHEYMEEILLEEEQKREANLKDEQDMFDQEALRYTLEEEAKYKRKDEERLREQKDEEEYDRKHDYFHPSNLAQEESFEQEPYNRNVMTIAANVQTQESVVANLKPITSVTLSADKGKQVAEPSEEPNPEPQAKKKGSKRKALASSEEVSLRIIFHKNMERSERIFNQSEEIWVWTRWGRVNTRESILFDVALGRVLYFHYEKNRLDGLSSFHVVKTLTGNLHVHKLLFTRRLDEDEELNNVLIGVV